MAKSKRKQAKSRKAKTKKAKARTARKKVKARTLKSKKSRGATAKAKSRKAKSGSAAKKAKRRKRRTEADMSWPEVRASRLRKSEGREERIVRDFERAVNMTPKALEAWLETEESRSVGVPRKSDPAESVGHWSGRRIIEIRNKNPLEYEAEDYAHMRKVSAYVARHGAQRPQGDVTDTRWRYSLMNWGHDPLK